MPLHELTPLYARIFCTLSTPERLREILHARKVLFELATANTAATDQALGAEIKGTGGGFQALRPETGLCGFGQDNQGIQGNATPTCFVKYSNTDIRKYLGR